MSVSSEFYRDLSKVEKKAWGMSYRQLRAYLLLAVVSLILILEALFLPDWAFFIVTFPTALVLGIYPVLLLINQWREKRRKLELYFLFEERLYSSGKIRRYDKHEFIQSNKIKETDSIE